MADDKKKKISLGGIDNAAEEKGSFMKTLWQLVKFLVVSGLVTIIQLVLANVLPLIFDGVTATLPVFLQGIFDPNVIFDASTKEGIEQVGKYVIDGTIQNGSVVGGVVTWGYLLPFFLSNLIANIYGFYQNKKTTFKSDAPWYSFAFYIVLMIALILFSTWFQGWLVGIIAKINWAWIQPLARTIAGCRFCADGGALPHGEVRSPQGEEKGRRGSCRRGCCRVIAALAKMKDRFPFFGERLFLA